MIGFGQNVNIPDVNFKAYLVANSAINTNGDTEIQISEANIFSGSIDCSFGNIYDLTGIEHFTALTTLSCDNNQLTTLDVTQNTALTTLSCENNQLTTLDVTQNTALINLACRDNQITNLDLSGASALVQLYCNNNNLSSLDLSQNTACANFSGSNNNLTSLDLRNGNNQNSNSPNFINNPYLTCVNVDDVGYSNSNWTNFGSQSYFSTSCIQNYTYVPDNNFEAYLESNGMGNGIANDDSVITSFINTTQSLNVTQMNIADLTGIEDFTALTNLYCDSNQLISLDVSQNTALIYLQCGNNQLTSLDLSNNTALTTLNCRNNNLTSLDLRNGNYQNSTFGAWMFNLTNNPNLTCISVDNVIWSNSAFLNIDIQHYFSTNCSYTTLPKTFVPDDNFEAFLEANGMGNGIPNDDSVVTAFIDTATYLNVNNQSISDLTSIEYFTALTAFSCNSNQLTALDITQNTALINFSCNSNQLTALDVTQNTALTQLQCYGNSISSLNVSQNTALTTLRCDTNQLTSIDVSQNTALTHFLCYYNQLTSLDVSQNTALIYLECGNNQLTSLDLSGATDLEFLDCKFNNLTSLDVSNNTALTTLLCYDNFISCLDISSNLVLNSLNCSNNLIDQLNTKNGNWINNLFVNALSNNLLCAEVDNIGYALNNWLFDSFTTPNTNCNYTNICNVTYGCTDLLACNYNLSANVDDSSCVYPTSSYDTLSVTASIVWNGLPLSVSGDYSTILINSVGCDSTVNLNLSITTTGISDIVNNKSNLIKITDMLGQETPYRRNTPLFYIFDDGTVEKRMVIE